MRINLMRYTGIFDLEKINKITLYEYSLINRAVALRNVDNQRNMSVQSFYNQLSTATDKEGYFKFNTPNKFFDFNKNEAEAFGKEYHDPKEIKQNRSMDLLSLLNSKTKGGS